MDQTERFVGIDVSKSTLDVAVWPAAAPWTEAHTESGITALVERLQALQPTLIVLEATGGLELPLAGALGAANLPVAVVNPRQVRDFAAHRSGKAANKTTGLSVATKPSLTKIIDKL